MHNPLALQVLSRPQPEFATELQSHIRLPVKLWHFHLEHARRPIHSRRDRLNHVYDACGVVCGAKVGRGAAFGSCLVLHVRVVDFQAQSNRRNALNFHSVVVGVQRLGGLDGVVQVPMELDDEKWL